MTFFSFLSQEYLSIALLALPVYDTDEARTNLTVVTEHKIAFICPTTLMQNMAVASSVRTVIRGHQYKVLCARLVMLNKQGLTSDTCTWQCGQGYLQQRIF